MKKTTSGFTLIELTVVIIVIGILSTIGIFVFTGIQAKARDTERESKTTIIAEAMEKYYDLNGEYPSCADIANTTTITQKLDGIDSTVFKAPGDTSSNSISSFCDSPSTDPTINKFTYIGHKDGIGDCQNSSCAGWTISYKKEGTGETVVISSRHGAITTIEAPNAPTVTAIGNNNTLNYEWTNVACNSGTNVEYQTLYSTSFGHTSSLNITTSNQYNGLTPIEGFIHTLRVEARCKIGSITSNWSLPGSADYYKGVTKLIAAGNNNHTCAIKANGANSGKVFCWGSNKHYNDDTKTVAGDGGQLGDGTFNDSPSPIAVALGNKTAKALAIGDEHTCIIANDDKAYCWGYNGQGQLGNGNNTISNSPVAVSGDKQFKSISANDDHTCAIDFNDKAYCWGANNYGNLGFGATSPNAKNTPTEVVITGVASFPADGKFKSISAGYLYNCGIASNDKAFCWGNNQYGKLGIGDTTDQSKPVAVIATGAMAEKSIKYIATGNHHTCAIDSINKAYCWGLDGMGQLGRGFLGYTSKSSSPITVQTVAGIVSNKITSIAVSDEHTCLVAVDYTDSVTTAKGGKAYCWGENGSSSEKYGGEVGDSTPISRKDGPVAVYTTYPNPNQNNSLYEPVNYIAAGRYYNCAVTSSFTPYCWGDNKYGQLGIGSITSNPGKLIPTKVNDFPL